MWDYGEQEASSADAADQNTAMKAEPTTARELDDAAVTRDSTANRITLTGEDASNEDAALGSGAETRSEEAPAEATIQGYTDDTAAEAEAAEPEAAKPQPAEAEAGELDEKATPSKKRKVMGETPAKSGKAQNNRNAKLETVGQELEGKLWKEAPEMAVTDTKLKNVTVSLSTMDKMRPLTCHQINAPPGVKLGSVRDNAPLVAGLLGCYNTGVLHQWLEERVTILDEWLQISNKNYGQTRREGEQDKSWTFNTNLRWIDVAGALGFHNLTKHLPLEGMITLEISKEKEMRLPRKVMPAANTINTIWKLILSDATNARWPQTKFEEGKPLAPHDNDVYRAFAALRLWAKRYSHKTGAENVHIVEAIPLFLTEA